MNKTGAVIDREKFGLLQTQVNDALRKAQLYAERRIQLRDQVEEKQKKFGGGETDLYCLYCNLC